MKKIWFTITVYIYFILLFDTFLLEKSNKNLRNFYEKILIHPFSNKSGEKISSCLLFPWISLSFLSVIIKQSKLKQQGKK